PLGSPSSLPPAPQRPGDAQAARMSLAELMKMERGGEAYRLSALLPDRLRGLVDLHSGLGSGMDAADLFFHLWSYACDRSVLAAARQARLGSAVKRGPAGLGSGGARRWQVLVNGNLFRWRRRYQELGRFRPTERFTIVAKVPAVDEVALVEPEGDGKRDR